MSLVALPWAFEAAWLAIAAVAIYTVVARRLNDRAIAAGFAGVVVLAYVAGALLHAALTPPAVLEPVASGAAPDPRIWRAQLSGLTCAPRVTRGTTLEGAIIAENRSPVIWPTAGEVAIRIGYEWLDEHGASVLAGRVTFERPVAPLERVRRTFAIAVPAQPGRYQLRFDLVYETIRWFLDPVSVAVTVT